MKKNGLNRPKAIDYIFILLFIVLALIVLYPFYNAVLISLVSENDYVRTPFLLYPKRIVLSSYKYIIKKSVLFTGMKNTGILTAAGVLYNMALTVICAYVLTKEFPGKKLLLYLIVFTIYFTGGLIPYYLLIKNLGLMDTIASMILPTGINFMYMTVIRRYFENIPVSLIESAKIDGASEIRILYKIVFPLSLPIMATFALYYGVDRWNEWWNGLLFIKTIDKQPLQLILRNIVQDATATNSSASSASGMVPFGDGIKMASTVLSMLPIMCIYPFLQKYFVSGMMVGAVKE